MPSTYTTNLNLELQATGENSGTWGSRLNANDFQIVDQALGGVQALSLSGSNITITTDQSQNNFLVLTGTLTANVSVIFPAIGRTYQVMNGTTGAFTVTMQIGATPSGAVAAVPQGGVQTVVMDGTNVYLITSGAPTGKIGIFVTPTAPFGYLECNGAAVSRTTYPALNNLAAIASYGAPWAPGDGSTTFNVPDLRGYFVRGWDDGAGRDSGRAFGSTQTSQNLSHTHGISDPGHVHTLTLSSGGGNAYTPSGTPARWSNDSVLGASPTATVSRQGTGITVNSSGSTEARPINIALLYAIKT